MSYLSQQLSKVLFAVTLTIVLTIVPNPVFAASPPFVIQSKTGASTKSLTIKVKKPKLPRKYVLGSLEIRGCWLMDGLKSVKVTPAKSGKVLKFRLNGRTGALELKKILPAQFPLKITASLKEDRAIVTRGSKLSAIASNTCAPTQKGKKPVACVKTQISVEASFDGVECSIPADFEENSSPAAVLLADGDALDLHPLNTPLRFTVQGETFSTDLLNTTVIVNDASYFNADLTLAGNILSLQAALVDGRNTVSVRALDSQGRQLKGEFVIWAGANTLRINLVDESSQPVSQATVTLALADDKSVTKTVETQSGQGTFSNVPGTTVVITATTADHRSGFAATNGNAGTTTIKLISFQVSSAVANNDISQGVAGWSVGNAPVTVVPHVEDSGVAAAHVAGTLNAEVPDQDLVVNTLGQGLQFISRTFKVSPGTKSIEVRYRFQTTEFPGGYFGSRFNDFFNISIRTLSGGAINDGNSMNALGRGAFSPAGLTAWRTAKLPVNKAGDEVQVQLGVANVADGAYDSSITVDYVKESSFAITKAEILDIDNSQLTNLSADDHPYFEKFTYINGTIRIEGEADDALTNLELQIIQGTEVLKSAKLSTAASKKIVKKFGKAGFVEIKNPILMFKLFPNDAASFDSETDKTYSLRLHATSKKGQVSDFDGPSVGLLVRYKGGNRYDPRDELVGGDDWVKPSVRKYATNLSGLSFGDFSNMNGGRFPPHDEHDRGESIDAWFAGYNSRNGDVARQIIAMLGGTQGNPSGVTGGSRIRSVLVAYSRSEGSSFYNAIRGVTLRDGRQADRVISPNSEHVTHFHMTIAP